MRLNKKKIVVTKYGERVIEMKFAWLPQNIGHHYLWLENYSEQYEYKKNIKPHLRPSGYVGYSDGWVLIDRKFGKDILDYEDSK